MKPEYSYICSHSFVVFIIYHKHSKYKEAKFSQYISVCCIVSLIMNRSLNVNI